MSENPSIVSPAPAATPTTGARVEEFKREIADMRLRDPSAARDRRLLALGLVLMAAGVVTGIVAYVQSHGTVNPLQQRDMIIVALVSVSVTIVGAALFVRASIAQFLRFWLARLTYEQQAQTDRIVDAVTPPSVPAAGVSTPTVR